jgi:hypothetical protein
VVPCQKYQQELSSEPFVQSFCQLLIVLYKLVIVSPLAILPLRIIGNPSICGAKADNNCSAVFPEPLSFPPDAIKGV